MLNRQTARTAALLCLVPTASLAAGTQWRGTVTVRMNILLRTPLTPNQTVDCQVDLSDFNAKFTAQRLIQAELRTPTSYHCDVEVPYDWEDQSVSGGMIAITGTYSASIYDSERPAGLGDSRSSGTWPVANNLSGGLNHFTYATPVALY